MSWRREDNKQIEYGNWQTNKELGFEYRKNWNFFGFLQIKFSKIKLATSIDRESITINKVSRLHMGAYLCIAQNGTSYTMGILSIFFKN